MSNVTPFKRPKKADQACRYGFTPVQAKQHFEALRGDDSCIHHSTHLHDRMDERGVTIRQVMAALRHGRVEQEPYLEKENCWRMRYRDFVAGDDISVVVQLEKDKMGELLIVVTVIHHEEQKG
jgi:hypothetical protein